MKEVQSLNDCFFLENHKGFRFFVRSWVPKGSRPKGVLQIIHGMAEHGGRYEELAILLASKGYAVFIADHPGHGQTAPHKDALGIMPEKRGWQLMMRNQLKLLSHLKSLYNRVPVFIMGHSMGSLLARHFCIIYPVYFKGLILSGTNETPRFLNNVGRLLVSLQVLFLGNQRKVKWFNNFFYNKFNKSFKPAPTKFEWISSSRHEVDRYVQDPYCGFDCSVGFYRNLFWGIKEIKKLEHNLTFRKSLPILILSGDQDPVGSFGKDPIKVHANYFVQKFHKLSIKIFKGRHELLHEQNKEMVFEALLEWLSER